MKKTKLKYSKNRHHCEGGMPPAVFHIIYTHARACAHTQSGVLSMAGNQLGTSLVEFYPSDFLQELGRTEFDLEIQGRIRRKNQEHKLAYFVQHRRTKKCRIIALEKD